MLKNSYEIIKSWLNLYTALYQAQKYCHTNKFNNYSIN